MGLLVDLDGWVWRNLQWPYNPIETWGRCGQQSQRRGRSAPVSSMVARDATSFGGPGRPLRGMIYMVEVIRDIASYAQYSGMRIGPYLLGHRAGGTPSECDTRSPAAETLCYCWSLADCDRDSRCCEHAPVFLWHSIDYDTAPGRWCALRSRVCLADRLSHHGSDGLPADRWDPGLGYGRYQAPGRPCPGVGGGLLVDYLQAVGLLAGQSRVPVTLDVGGYRSEFAETPDCSLSVLHPAEANLRR